MNKKQLCPHLYIWRQLYTVLEEAYKQAGIAAMPPPPPAYNMQAWELSTYSQKQQRWAETFSWAEQNGFAHLIADLSDDECYEGD